MNVLTPTDTPEEERPSASLLSAPLVNTTATVTTNSNRKTTTILNRRDVAIDIEMQPIQTITMITSNNSTAASTVQIQPAEDDTQIVQYYGKYTKWMSLVSLVRKHFLKPIRLQGLQFLFSAAWMVTCVYWNSVVQILIQNEIIRRGLQNDNPLVDLGFDAFPYITFPLLADYYLFGVLALVLMKTFICWRVAGTLRIARRLLLIHGFIFILRSISISITMLPNPWSQCQAKVLKKPLLSAFLIIAGIERTCSDCLFSGHSVAMALMGWLWLYYTSPQYLFMRLGIIPVVFGGLFALISTHFHYTVDVFYGTTIATCVWISVHYIIRVWEEWLEARLYRNYLLLKHETELIKSKSPTAHLQDIFGKAKKAVTVSELVDEYLSNGSEFVCPSTIHMVYKEAQQDIVAWIEPDEEIIHEDHWLVQRRGDTGKKSKSFSLIKRRINSLSKQISGRYLFANRTLYMAKKIILICVLKFLIWFENWYGYLEMDFVPEIRPRSRTNSLRLSRKLSAPQLPINVQELERRLERKLSISGNSQRRMRKESVSGTSNIV
jgi:hypothetical protein